MPSGLLSKKSVDAEREEGKEEWVGPRWGCVAIDRETRFVVAWAFASSEEEAAKEVVWNGSCSSGEEAP